jgi:hypothetical protein
VIQLTPHRQWIVSVSRARWLSHQRVRWATGVQKFADVSGVIYRSLSLQNHKNPFSECRPAQINTGLPCG